MDWIFLLNVIWLLLLGVAVLYWIGSFTDYLQTVVGLLGLGGIFAWAAFFLNLIREERKKEWQSMLDDLLRRKVMSLALLACTGIVVVARLNVGCIVVDSRRDTADRWIEIRPAGSRTPSHSADVFARLNAKFPVCAGFAGRDYEIDVEGLPMMVRHIRPFPRTWLRSPGDFLHRSIVLVRPSPKVSLYYSAESDAHHMLSIRIDDNEVGEIPFRGRTVWIGSGKPLHIPSLLQDKWRTELAADNHALASALPLWLEADVYPNDRIGALKAGQRLKVTVSAPGAAKAFAEGADFVRMCNGEEDFPQVLYLEQSQ